jgi:hypothetical protein
MKEIYDAIYKAQDDVNELITQDLIKLGLKKRKLKDQRYVEFWTKKNNIEINFTSNFPNYTYFLYKNSKPIRKYELNFPIVEKELSDE